MLRCERAGAATARGRISIKNRAVVASHAGIVLRAHLVGPMSTRHGHFTDDGPLPVFFMAMAAMAGGTARTLCRNGVIGYRDDILLLHFQRYFSPPPDFNIC